MNFLWWLILLIPIAIWIIYVDNKKYTKKLKTLANSRPALTKEQYLLAFTSIGYNESHVEVIYDEIKSYMHYKWFFIYPEDDFYRDYEIDPEDLDDMVVEMYNKLSLTFPEQHVINAFYERRSNKMDTLYLLDLMCLK